MKHDLARRVTNRDNKDEKLRGRGLLLGGARHAQCLCSGSGKKYRGCCPPKPLQVVAGFEVGYLMTPYR